MESGFKYYSQILPLPIPLLYVFNAGPDNQRVEALNSQYDDTGNECRIGGFFDERLYRRYSGRVPG